MDIEYKGANCITISRKKEVFITDPKLSLVGLKDYGAHATAILLTQPRFAVAASDEPIIVNGPGEYEVNNCSIMGIAAHAHSDDPDSRPSSTMYRLSVDDISIAILGHIAPSLSEQQREDLGRIDVLVVPVGDHGYTLDAKSAVELVRQLDPKIVIPTHYADDDLTYEVAQADISEFLKELSAPHEVSAKLKLKAGQLPAQLTVYHMTRTK